jgi:hypothetical protein
MTSARVLGLLLLLGVAGCEGLNRPDATSSRTPPAQEAGAGSFGALTYRAVDRMLDFTPIVTPATPLVVATIADVQNLDRSSALGNITADLIRSRLVQRGMTVSEVRLRTAMRLSPVEGEMMLSREARLLARAPDAAAILTGTYAVGLQHVWISLKLISRADSRVIAAADFAVPRFGDVDGLLSADAAPRMGR